MMRYQLLFSEPVLTALALFGPFPTQLLNWVAQYPARVQAGLRPPIQLAAVPELAACPVRVPRYGALNLPDLYAQLPELEDGAADWAFAFPVGTDLHQLEAATRLCQLGAAAGWRMVRLVPQAGVLSGWLRSATAGYALVQIYLQANGQPLWGEVTTAGTGSGAAQVRALLALI